MTIGIYCLKFKGTDKVYIGQCSTDIERLRYTQHLYKLRKGISAKKLQEAYNTYGIPCIEIIEACSIEKLNETEEKYIREFNSVDNGFNTFKTSNNIGYGESNGNSMLSNIQIINIFHLLIDSPEKTYKEIANLMQTTERIVSCISYGITHQWLEELFPEKYAKLKILLNNRYKSRSAKDQGITYPNIQSPAGEIFQVENVSKFAREHNLHQSSLSRVLRGIYKTHMGWKLC